MLVFHSWKDWRRRWCHWVFLKSGNRPSICNLSFQEISLDWSPSLLAYFTRDNLNNEKLLLLFGCDAFELSTNWVDCLFWFISSAGELFTFQLLKLFSNLCRMLLLITTLWCEGSFQLPKTGQKECYLIFLLFSWTEKYCPSITKCTTQASKVFIIFMIQKGERPILSIIVIFDVASCF